MYTHGGFMLMYGQTNTVLESKIKIFKKFKKNTFESVLMRQMKLEPIIQSEVSQKENHQYGIIIYIYGTQKDGNDNPVCKTAKETQMYRTDFWTLREGEGGMIWENGIETRVISSMK